MLCCEILQGSLSAMSIIHRIILCFSGSYSSAQRTVKPQGTGFTTTLVSFTPERGKEKEKARGSHICLCRLQLCQGSRRSHVQEAGCTWWHERCSVDFACLSITEHVLSGSYTASWFVDNSSLAARGPCRSWFIRISGASGIRLMEPFSGDTEESTEDIPGRKKSKLKILKTRLFGRSKRTGGEGNAKLSQSASDITAGKGLGSEEDLVCSQGIMGSRALSHDSIFLADQVLTDPEPDRVLSQENVHSKVKALQMKLQQQTMHLGPPPVVMPMRRPADLSSQESLPHGPAHDSGEDSTSQEALTKEISQPTSCALSPNLKPAPTRSLPSTPSHSLSPSPAAEAPSDFSSPAQFTPCLDTSAARHRMSIKPRNQRASTKKKLAVTDSQSHLETLNNIDRREPVKELKQHLGVQEEVAVETKKEEEVCVPVVHECLPSKSSEVAPTTSEAPSKLSGQSLPKQGHAPPVASQVLRVKPPRRVDSTSRQRPHSSFIESGLKEQRQGDLEKQSIPHDKENTLYKPGMTEISPDLSSPRRIKRSTQGSGSFHFSVTTSKNQDGERPRSGSFLGVLERAEARNRTTSETEEKSTRGKEELKELRERPFAFGRLRPEGAPPKTSAAPWDKRDSLKKVESATPSKDALADAGAAEAEDMESSQEEVEEAVEAKEVQEEQGKTAFGIKLRSTSHSLKLRFDAASNRHSKSALGEEQHDKQKCQEISEKKQQAPSSSGELRPTDQTPSGFSPPLKHSAPFTGETSEVQTASANPKEAEATPQEPQPAPQAASSEVSWMALAMEKTRSLQQLFTSRFPRDFAGNLQANMQSAVHKVQPTNQTETVAGTQVQTQTVQAASQPSVDTGKVEKAQSGSQAQTIKTSPILLPQKAERKSPTLSNASRDPQMSKHTSEEQTNTLRSVSHSVGVTSPRTTQSPVRSPSQTDSSCQFAQGSSTQSLAQSYLSSGQQQSSWNNRGLDSAQQLKSSSSGPRGEGEAGAQKEGPPLTARRAFWSGSVSEKAAFLERRAEWTTPPGAKGVDLRKAHTDTQASGESPTLAKTTPVHRDAAAEEIQAVQAVNLAELSPTKVPERPREDRWLRKNAPSSSSPSSSPTLPSVLQSMSDSGQPSWMELAKRKSMAWSDKTMD